MDKTELNPLFWFGLKPKLIRILLAQQKIAQTSTMIKNWILVNVFWTHIQQIDPNYFYGSILHENIGVDMFCR